MDPAYALIHRIPSFEDYRRLRVAAGLSPRSAEAAAAGLPNTAIGIVIEKDGYVVGMGRVIGDGGLFFQIVDIAVEPEHQGVGLGKAIIGALVERLREMVPAEAYVILIADGEANRLYTRYGFAPTGPASIGMAMWVR